MKKVMKHINMFISAIFYYIWTALHKKDYSLWLFGAWKGMTYNDNPKYLFEYISANNPEIKAVWVTKNPTVYDLVKNKNVIVIINKCEIKNLIDKNYVSRHLEDLLIDNIINLSVKDDIGFEDLEKIIRDKFILNDLDFIGDSIVLTNSRHVEALNNARIFLNNAITSLSNSIPLDIVSIDVRRALSFVMNITGEDVTESIIDNIFSKFCIGK